ncbi:hypothetical protein D3C74_497760 [compost metagenome]
MIRQLFNAMCEFEESLPRYNKPHWETALEYASNDVIKKTGMNKKELKALLNYLYERRIIN